jgi:hypothetical protein
MRRPAIIGALLLVGGGVVLGTTVFRADIAQATGLAQSVTVANTSANPVPVHEQGTASVNVTNTTLTVSDQATTQLLTSATLSDATGATRRQRERVQGSPRCWVCRSLPAGWHGLPRDQRQGGRR